MSSKRLNTLLHESKCALRIIYRCWIISFILVCTTFLQFMIFFPTSTLTGAGSQSQLPRHAGGAHKVHGYGRVMQLPATITPFPLGLHRPLHKQLIFFVSTNTWVSELHFV